MKTLAIALLLLALLVGASCDKIQSGMKAIPGKVAGQVLDSHGQGQGYLSVELVNVETGTTDYKQNTEDNGGFFLDGVVPGKYTLKVMQVGGVEIPNDQGEINLTPGKTLNLTVTINREKQADQTAGA